MACIASFQGSLTLPSKIRDPGSEVGIALEVTCAATQKEEERKKNPQSDSLAPFLSHQRQFHKWLNWALHTPAEPAVWAAVKTYLSYRCPTETTQNLPVSFQLRSVKTILKLPWPLLNVNLILCLIGRGKIYFVQNKTTIFLSSDTRRTMSELPCRTNTTHFWRQIRSLKTQNVSYFSLFTIRYRFGNNLQWEKFPDFISFPVNLQWRQNDRVFPACWILIGLFKFQAHHPYARPRLINKIIKAKQRLLTPINIILCNQLAQSMLPMRKYQFSNLLFYNCAVFRDIYFRIISFSWILS